MAWLLLKELFRLMQAELKSSVNLEREAHLLLCYHMKAYKIMKRILIIEDDPDIRMALEDDFYIEGYAVDLAIDGLTGFNKAQDLNYDLILLDLMLPEMNGMEICKQIRGLGIGTPIIMLTAKSQEIDKVLGLEIGADDYVTKPFSPHELQARVKAVLRRSSGLTSSNETTIYRSGPFMLDFTKHTFFYEEEYIHLTGIEFSIMHILMAHEGDVLKRDLILDQVWGEDVFVTPRTVDTHLANLRKKLAKYSAREDWIVGLRGVGYRFASTVISK